MRRRSIGWLAAACAAGALLVAATDPELHLGDAAVAYTADEQDEGSDRVGFPLGSFHPTGMTARKNVGQVFSNGSMVVFNLGPDPIRIVSVRPEIDGDGLTYLGAYVAGPERRYGFNQTDSHFPPTARSLGIVLPAEGAELAPGTREAKEGVEVFMGFEISGPGRTTVPSVDITYEVDGDRHTSSWTQTMAICTEGEEADCEPEYGDAG